MPGTITWARVKSPWVLHFNSGACNGCDIEIVALLTPKYDVERFGVKLEPSPRHADVLLVTGCVTQQCAERLKRVYDQMPQPKFVVAIGACACWAEFSQETTTSSEAWTKLFRSPLTSQDVHRVQKRL